MPSRNRRRTSPVRTALIVVAVALPLILVVYLAYLNYRIDRKLGGGVAHARTRFYSDRFRIVPGMDIRSVGLLERLERLGYRSDPELDDAGTWRRVPAGLEIRIRGFRDPVGSLPERRTRIELEGSRVIGVIDLARRVQRPQATLEPMILDATWNGAWEARRPVRLADLPKRVKDAILAAEDSRFYRHGGVDFMSVVRAAWVNFRQRRVAQGASTITQQLAKNFFLTPERTLSRKAQEALLAWLLEARMSKDEIFEWYLNDVYLGSHAGANVIGIGQAARTFFGKRPQDLTAGEAATIGGIISAPNLNSPLRYPDRARKRRDAVLGLMAESGFITRERAAAEKAATLRVRTGAAPAIEGLFLLQQVRRDVEGRLGEDSVIEGRLEVYTTLDPILQRGAEAGLRRALAGLERNHKWLRAQKGKNPLEGSFLAVDTFDGAVRVLVGGRDFAHRPFDHAVKARRQAGSTFKPFVYLAAFQAFPREITPSTILYDEPVSILSGGRVWRPVNYDERFRGPVTVRTALENSLNVPTVRLAQRIGVDTIAREASAAGWDTELPRVPALALGVAETSLIDLAGVYTTFPRMGMPVSPYMLRGVIDRKGKVVVRHEQKPHRASDARATYLVHHILEGVVDRGTARGLRTRGFEGPLAGKTGTTNDYRDAWFVGYTPELLGAAWVGFDDGRPLRLSSAATALDVWAQAMKPIVAGMPQRAFEVPSGIVFVDVDPHSGLLPASECPRSIREAFLPGTEPDDPCHQRPDLFAGGPFEEPLEAPARIVGGILRGVFGGIFGKPSPPPRRRAPDPDEERDTRSRRRYPAEIDEMANQLERLRDQWDRGQSERRR